MKNKNIEVEGGEILLTSKEGHYAVIPAKHRQEVMDMVKDGCDDCINNYIQALPKDSDYAEDGSLYPEEPDNGILPSYYKGSDENPIELNEITVTAKAPTYIKYKQEWEKENPFDINKYVEDRFNNPIGREAIKRIDEKGWRKVLQQEGMKKRKTELDEATKMGLLYQRFNPQDRDDIPMADEQFEERYGTSLHRYRYDNDAEYRKYYEQQAKNATSKIGYPSTDLRNKNVVSPNNMWMYPNLTGETKKTMTDFSNEVIGMALPIPGLESMGKIPSVFKAGKNLIKGADKVDDVAKVLPKFKSEINWAKWNKEIPNNESLLKEYNAIEQAHKELGTWMKNPDGSAFKGTPEQFVQQQSSNFKKAFPNPVLDDVGNIQYNYHGTPNKLEDDFFKEHLSEGKLYGDGLYTTPKKDYALGFAKKRNNNSPDQTVYELYQNANKKQELTSVLEKSDERFKSFLKENPKGSKDFDKKFAAFMKQEDDLFEKYYNPNDFKLKQGFDYFKPNDLEQVVPYSNYPKSAIGNNGMFDMTNPNIYKSLIPLLGYESYIKLQQSKSE